MGVVLRATATSASSLLVFTFIYSVGVDWSLTNLPKLISAWFPRERAGIATGIYSIGLFAGIALPMASTMSQVFPIINTFQGFFFMWSIPPIVAAFMWWMLVRDPPLSHIHNESVTKDKVSLRRVFRNRDLWLVAFYFVLSNFFFYTWSGWAPSLLLLKGATSELAGLISSVFMWIAIPTAFLMPKLVYKVGLRKPFLWVTGVVLALASWGAIQANITTSWLVMGLGNRVRQMHTLHHHEVGLC